MPRTATSCPSHHFVLQEERRTVRPLASRRCPVHIDAFIPEYRRDSACHRLSVDFSKCKTSIIGKHSKELAIVIGCVNYKIVTQGRVLQHLIELADRVIRLLHNARRDPPPFCQPHVVPRFRMHLIDERLVVEEFDLDRASWLNRLRTCYQLNAL